jgi:hypothetical protein
MVAIMVKVVNPTQENQSYSWMNECPYMGPKQELEIEGVPDWLASPLLPEFHAMSADVDSKRVFVMISTNLPITQVKTAPGAKVVRKEPPKARAPRSMDDVDMSNLQGLPSKDYYDPVTHQKVMDPRPEVVNFSDVLWGKVKLEE